MGHLKLLFIHLLIFILFTIPICICIIELNYICNSNYAVFFFEDSKTFGQQLEEAVEDSEATVEQQAHLHTRQLKLIDLLVTYRIDHGLAFPWSILVVVHWGVQQVCRECWDWLSMTMKQRNWMVKILQPTKKVSYVFYTCRDIDYLYCYHQNRIQQLLYYSLFKNNSLILLHSLPQSEKCDPFFVLEWKL